MCMRQKLRREYWYYWSAQQQICLHYMHAYVCFSTEHFLLDHGANTIGLACEFTGAIMDTCITFIATPAHLYLCNDMAGPGVQN